MGGDQRGSLAVIGGGVIGLSIARRAAVDGWSVRVHRGSHPGLSAAGPSSVSSLDLVDRRGPSAAGPSSVSSLDLVDRPCASWVAGGMLAPHSEGWPGEESLLRIGLESLALWRADGPGSYLDGLPSQVVTSHESLVVAVDRADAADLRTVGEWLSAQGHPVELTTSARDIEPLLAQGIRHGFRAVTELAVDNRAVIEALAQQCERLGVQWAGLVGSLEETADADTTVVANGIDAPALWPGLPIRPVKGEVLRLRWRSGCLPVPERVIRARVRGRQVYLVPRGDGVVVGATQYEHGRDTRPTVTGVRELLDDACAVMPALGEYELAECAAGLRPMTPDNLPLVERLDERTLVAAGHGRSGFLLAPWTVEKIMAELMVVNA